MKYIKKPLVIEAFKYGYDEIPEWVDGDKCIEHQPVQLNLDSEKTFLDNFMIIHTSEGHMRADKGDYVIKGIKGEIYPCKPDIFEATYNKVPDEIEEDFLP